MHPRTHSLVRVARIRAGWFIRSAGATLLCLGSLIDAAEVVSDTPFKYGKVSLRPRFQYQFNYEDGLLAAPGRPVSTFTDTIAPGILVNLGQNLSLDYAFTRTTYSTGSLRDTTGHTLSLLGSQTFQAYALTFGDTYSVSTPVLLETGRQTPIESSITQFGVTRTLGTDFSLSASGSQDLEFIAAANDHFTWTTQAGVGYAINARTNVSLQIVSSYTAVYHSPDILMLQPQLATTWRPRKKLSFDASIGSNYTRYASPRPFWAQNLAFSGGAHLQPGQKTTFSVTTQRSVSAATLAGAAVTATTVGATLTRVFLKHINWSVGMSRQNNRYHSTLESGRLTRDDNVIGYDSSIGTTFLRHGTLSIAYSYQHDNSGAQGFTFNRRSVGVNIGYAY